MAITKKGTKWETKNSLWIIISFILFFNGISMYYAGKKVKVKKWCKRGLIYMLMMWIPVIGAQVKVKAIEDILTTVCIISYIVCIIDCFMIRMEYLLRLEVLEDNKMQQIENDILKDKFAKEYGINNREIDKVVQSDNEMHDNLVENHKKLDNKINNNEELRKEEEPSASIKYNIVTPEVPLMVKIPEMPKMEDLHEFSKQKELLDINSCTESELADLPGVGLILAKKAVNLRNNNNGFTSVDEFVQKLGIKPHFTENLKTMVCCIPMKNIENETVKHKGRMVDF